MSVVGPRPLTPADIDRLGWDQSYYESRWRVRPGVIGPAQLLGSNRCHAHVTWLYDRRYVQRANLGCDLCMLGAGLVCAVLGKRATGRIFARLLGRTKRRKEAG